MHLDDWLKMKNPACSAVKLEAGGGLRANELVFALGSEPAPGRTVRINSGEFALQLLAP
jgi:hypothetical protein